MIAKSHQLMSEIGHQNTCEVIKQKKLGENVKVNVYIPWKCQVSDCNHTSFAAVQTYALIGYPLRLIILLHVISYSIPILVHGTRP